LVILVVGIVAGWLAGNVVEGGGLGLVWDLVIGLVGAGGNSQAPMNPHFTLLT
jgi:uncharacterized membrane protein YeaQ/YmgE (transglycosylase-associated protein family)